MTAALRKALRSAWKEGLAGVALGERVARSLPEPPRDTGRCVLLAVGKGAASMANGALSRRDWAFAEALVVVPERAVRESDDPRAAWLEAPHPDPDRRSVVAARRAIAAVRASDFVVALISGGASSLICLPRGIPLSRYVRITRALRLAGADVRDVNVVRRHLCAVKGGGLARIARGHVWTLIASDVLGGGPHDVGSGPTVVDPTRRADASSVLRRYVSELPVPPLHESLKAGSRAARGLNAWFIARPEDLAIRVADALRARSFDVRVLRPSVATVDDLAHEYAALVMRLGAGQAVVRAAEPSLQVPGARAGRGGRSTHLAVAVSHSLPRGAAFLAGASDGVDGTGETSGAVVDASLLRRCSRDAIDRALGTFDTGPLVRVAGMALPYSATGTNLADVHVLARGHSRDS